MPLGAHTRFAAMSSKPVRGLQGVCAFSLMGPEGRARFVQSLEGAAANGTRGTHRRAQQEERAG